MFILKKPELIQENIGFVEGNVKDGYGIVTDDYNVILYPLTFKTKPEKDNPNFDEQSVGELKNKIILGYFKNLQDAIKYITNHLIMDFPPDSVENVEHLDYLQQKTEKFLNECLNNINKKQGFSWLI